MMTKTDLRVRSPERRRGSTLAKSSEAKPIKCNSRNDYHYKEEEEHMLKKQDDGDVDNDNQNEYTNTE